MAATSGPRVVVIAVGGFAGLFTARALGPAPVQVTLIDRAERGTPPMGGIPGGERVGDYRQISRT